LKWKRVWAANKIYGEISKNTRPAFLPKQRSAGPEFSRPAAVDQSLATCGDGKDADGEMRLTDLPLNKLNNLQRVSVRAERAIPLSINNFLNADARTQALASGNLQNEIRSRPQWTEST
jgi:hypothetical protein